MAQADFTHCKAFVFDAYGTLFDASSAVNRYRDRLGDCADRLSTVWRSKQIEYTWLRSLMGSYADFWRVTGEALDYAMKACGLNDALLRSRLMNRYLTLDAYPEVRKTLESLKEKGLRTAVLSNGSSPMLVSALKSAGLYKLVDNIFCADKLKIYKPHPSVYQLAVDGLSLPPSEIAFQSANRWDIAGAGNAGFTTAWINRTAQQDDELPQRPTAMLSRLDELLGLLERRGNQHNQSA